MAHLAHQVDPDAYAQRFVPLRSQLLRQAASLLVLTAVACAGVLLALQPAVTGGWAVQAGILAVAACALALSDRRAQLLRHGLAALGPCSCRRAHAAWGAAAPARAL